MPKRPTPLDPHQQELVNIVSAAHQNLALARQTRSNELARRLAENRIRLQRELEESETRIRLNLDREVAFHESALDDALVAAYNSSVPIRRIALEGFGNRYDGGVQQLMGKLREEGRIGTRVGYQRNTTPAEEIHAKAIFPKALDVQNILTESVLIVPAPAYTKLPDEFELVPGINVTAVLIEMDSRDPWFRNIAKNAREGTQYKNATEATLYIHPSTGMLTAFESKETGETIWDHPVARWVKDHPEEARAGFDRALKDSE